MKIEMMRVDNNNVVTCNVLYIGWCISGDGIALFLRRGEWEERFWD